MDIKEIKMWPTIFHLANFPDSKQYNPEILKACYRLRDLGEEWDITQDNKVGLFESPPSFFEEPELFALVSFIVELLKSVMLSPGRTLKGIGFESWCHVTNDGGYHDVHMHRTVVDGVCGVYCVQAGQVSAEDANGVLRFYNHSPSSNNDEVMSYIPRDGQLILFPGHVPHGALPYRGEDDRVVVAFNAHFQP